MGALLILLLILAVCVRFRGFLQPPRPEHQRPEPWRDHEAAFLVPTSVVLTFVDPRYVSEIRRTEAEYLAALALQLSREGIKRPLNLVIDDQGKAALEDGTHRVLIANDSGWEHVPITIKRAARTRGYGRPLRDVFELVARSTAS